MLEARDPPVRCPQMGGNQGGAGVDFHGVTAQPHLQVLPHILVWHRVAHTVRLQMTVGMHCCRGPAHQLPRLWREWKHGRLFLLVNGDQRVLTSGAMDALAGHVTRLPHGSRPHLR